METVYINTFTYIQKRKIYKHIITNLHVCHNLVQHILSCLRVLVYMQSKEYERVYYFDRFEAGAGPPVVCPSDPWWSVV